jgi:hypothetical protein
VVFPAFSALFSAPIREDLGNGLPIFEAVLGDVFQDFCVFLGCESAFRELGVEAFGPSGGNLGSSAELEVGSNQVPVVSVDGDQLANEQVFGFGPAGFHANCAFQKGFLSRKLFNN